MSERNKDEEKLFIIAKEFHKFLELSPQIRFNLHKVLREIDDRFSIITANL